MRLTQENLIDYISTKLHPLDRQKLNSNTPLFSEGLLDSFHMIELITHIETESGIHITPLEVTLPNLDSIAKILRFIETKEKSGVIVE